MAITTNLGVATGNNLPSNPMGDFLAIVYQSLYGCTVYDRFHKQPKTITSFTPVIMQTQINLNNVLYILPQRQNARGHTCFV